MKQTLLCLLLLWAAPLWAYELKEQGLFKETYIMPLSYEMNSPDDRKSHEIKFRFSLYQRLLNWSGNQLTFAYTQTSWWQAYDQAQSRPFRETNYNPELFLSLPPLNIWGNPWIHLGGEHESNGGREPFSRSWNRLYVRYGLEYEGIQFRHKLFWRLPEQAKSYPTDPLGDENPDIVDYYGINEFEVVGTVDELTVFGRFRHNLATGRGATEISTSYPLKLNKTSLIIQFFQGYGESLADYNRVVTKWSVGILLNTP